MIVTLLWLTYLVRPHYFQYFQGIISNLRCFMLLETSNNPKRFFHATLFCGWSIVFTDWCSISISTWWSQKFWHFFEATVIFCKTDVKLYKKNGKTNQYCNWILTRVSSTCATLVSTLLRAAIAWKSEEEIKSAHQHRKWSPDWALDSEDGKSFKIGNSHFGSSLEQLK